ncbi:diguanylate cyclase [Photobacterium aquae]|uniref:diguanylate cyclase n=2 Tax=Photobacterium aquae TaxID=1195763 RepID=A0A0J1GWQ8_9GAMM|nr:diguanylate cyclase [Photobacterium aquae]
MMSLRNILTLIVVLGSLLPAYWMGISMIEKHQHDLLVEKELKLANSTKGIRDTVEKELLFNANLTQWYSKDRLMVQGMHNVLYSSVVRPKIEDFDELSSSISAAYIIDRDWQPMYEINGSMYHLEKSKLLATVRGAQDLYEKGLTFHTSYNDENLVLDGGPSGIVFVSPLLPYTLVPEAYYEPQGYIMVLVSYEDLAKLSRPFLYQQESVSFQYGKLNKLGYNANRFVTYLTLNKEGFASPVELTIIHRISDVERNKELAQSKEQMIRIIIVALCVTLILAILVTRWLIQPIKEIEKVVRSFRRQIRPEINPHKYQFSEFKQLVSLIDSLWQRVTKQMDQLEIRNTALREANQQVQDTNLQLADFNQRLENTVAEQTAELRASLAREEQYQSRLMTLIHFSAAHTGVSYHDIPNVINSGLETLFPNYGIRFGFAKPDSQTVITLTSSEGNELGYFDCDVLALSCDDTILFELLKKLLHAWLELEDFARRDKLSTCLNRTAFDSDFEHAKAEMQNKSSDFLAVLIVDINGLKTLNDNYGHDRGDTLIVKSAQLIRSALSDRQYLYRIGGDEFAIVARECNQAQLRQLMADLARVQNGQWIDLNDDEQYPLTFSVGGASSETESLSQLISMADSDMYRNKRKYYDISDAAIL